MIIKKALDKLSSLVVSQEVEWENIYFPPPPVRVSKTVVPDERLSYNDTMIHIHNQLTPKKEQNGRANND